MARYHELNLERDKLQDIRNILNSMKTLAQMEAHKLEQVTQAQQAIAQTIEETASDFLHFFPETLPNKEPELKIILLIGSERGFCGDFNGHLLKEFQNSFASAQNIYVIGVGNKLESLLQNSFLNFTHLKGANVTEEIISVVDSLVQTLANHPPLMTLYAIYHPANDSSAIIEKLLPSFTPLKRQNIPFSHPPQLNLTPKAFLLELTDHYLNHTLHRILYSSLMAENQQRIHHLENATQHLDKKTTALLHRINVLRQEEIIEEIEVILLNQVDSDLPQPLSEDSPVKPTNHGRVKTKDGSR